MAKKPSGTQIEMLLPIPGKRLTTQAELAKKQTRSLSYDKIIESLRRKGLTKSQATK